MHSHHWPLQMQSEELIIYSFQSLPSIFAQRFFFFNQGRACWIERRCRQLLGEGKSPPKTGFLASYVEYFLEALWTRKSGLPQGVLWRKKEDWRSALLVQSISLDSPAPWLGSGKGRRFRDDYWHPPLWRRHCSTAADVLGAMTSTFEGIHGHESCSGPAFCSNPTVTLSRCLWLGAKSRARVLCGCNSQVRGKK